jgi:hypothetical protein
MLLYTLRSCVVLSFVLLLAGHDSWGQARGLRRMESRTRPGEIDTAAEGGQAGGKQIGRGYRLIDLRCASGEVIAGARIRRGAVLDHLQIACARPRCDGRGCQWTSYSWGMSAGNSGGGEPHPPMICAGNEMISGFRARVVSFTVFDYASDIEFECTPIATRPTAEGFFPAGQGSTWHHPEGGFQVGFAPEGARGLRRTPDGVSPFISCRTRGFGATAVSVGEADFVQRGQRIVQAVSLFCPGGGGSPATAADSTMLVNAMDQCLREGGPGLGSGLAYYSSPDLQALSRRTLDARSPYLSAMSLTRPFAQHVLSLRERVYGVRNTPDELMLIGDEIAGFLIRCVVTHKVIPDEDPRGWYAMFLSREGSTTGTDPAMLAQRKQEFWSGYQGGPLPLHITMRKPAEY